MTIVQNGEQIIGYFNSYHKGIGYIEPGTTIVSDFWNAYDCFKEKGYQDLKMNLKIYLVDPSQELTQTKSKPRNAAKSSLPHYHRKKYSFATKYLFIEIL
ncbi:hypothetical protein LSTR_LSTR001109 [Laodelphax striatellus]|uniref:Uncharacterized protein n=1 Tax=Laodelphax striatellus TaxID=195883 RepID=A0A482X236_LAOST|nr:hypothetical protein LSTR_LSTR001109 [Laodelphax striatellus]